MTSVPPGIKSVSRPMLALALVATQIELAILNLAINARDAVLEGDVVTTETANRHLGRRRARNKRLRATTW